MIGAGGPQCALEAEHYSQANLRYVILAMEKIAYKANAERVMGRLRLLYSQKAVDRIFATFQVPSPTLDAFRAEHSEGFCDCPDPTGRIAFWDSLLKERVDLEDDSFPAAYLSEFDQGLVGGMLGGHVQFMCDPETGSISSMVKPLLEDWQQFDRLKLDESHPWYRRYAAQLDIFAEASTGMFGVSHLILIDGLNFVFELVGATATYTSLFECPEMVRKAIDFAFDLNVKIQNTYFQRVPMVRGGTCSNMAQWIPGKIVSESIDPFHMTSVAVFEEWGREPVERIFSLFDGGVLHIHGNGRYLLEAACTLNGLKAIYMGDDRGFPPAFEVQDELRKRAGAMPLIVPCEFNAFVEGLHRRTLQGGILYGVAHAPGIDAANECMKEVRAYRV